MIQNKAWKWEKDENSTRERISKCARRTEWSQGEEINTMTATLRISLTTSVGFQLRLLCSS